MWPHEGVCAGTPLGARRDGRSAGAGARFRKAREGLLVRVAVSVLLRARVNIHTSV
jgi:hypothetical protein